MTLTPKKRITTASGKAKGRRLQDLVRDKVRELLKPWGAVDDDISSAIMGQSGEDIKLSPLARKYLPVSIECKSKASMAIYTMWRQATDNSKTYEPVLVVKADRHKPLAVINLDYYLKLEDRRITYSENS